MSNSLVNALNGVSDNKTLTENGALTNSTTGKALLDLFAQIGSMRTRSDNEIVDAFKSAFAEDRLLAVKTLFWARDIRGGAGERRTFRVILNWLAKNHPSIVVNNLTNIAEYGRWDDLIDIVDYSGINEHAVELIKNQLVKDLEAEKPSLLGKWMPSANASSTVTKYKAIFLTKALKLTPKQYRQTLTTLRKKINIIETKMCQKEWGDINYEHVPSRAGLVYRKAFYRNDENRYKAYVEALSKGEAKVNATTLFPYDIVRNTGQIGYSRKSITNEEVKLLDAQWRALPDYFNGESRSWLPMIDVSGSMYGLPIETAIGLGIYCSERLKGDFQNKYLTFSGHPRFGTIDPSNGIVKNVKHVAGWNVGYNTNIQAAFELVLETAVDNNVPQEDLPDTIIVISDMEFDQVGPRTNFQAIKKRFKTAGYEMPRLVFWNVAARNTQFPITVNDKGVVLVSGHSASLFKSLLSGKDNPLDAMLDVILSERYEAVTL